jgi:uncharacterized protein (TIGR00730 family)
MPDVTEVQSQADYQSARLKAFFREVLAFLTGRPNALLAFDAVKEKLRIGGPIYRGVRPVPLDHIVGSVDRYRDFDRAFLPTQEHTADRWRRVNRAWYEDVNLPPVLLYQVGDVYFVVDGNHRVSVAKEQGQQYIDADVRECRVKVPVTPDLRPEDLEILGARVEFLERTGLDQLRPAAQVEVTILGGYDRLLEHIAVHRYFMGLDFKRDIAEAEAVEHWYDTVYLPVIEVVRASGMLEALPGKTDADFYLWIMDHRHYLVSEGKASLVEPGQVAEEFIQHYRATKTLPPQPDFQPVAAPAKAAPKVAAVFGGSQTAPGSAVYEAALLLGRELAHAGWTVMTGGYAGVMEAVSRGAAEAGGHVIGITCARIEAFRPGLRPNAWVKEEVKYATLRDRLYHLVERCDAAIALPGGVGTLSEVALTWSLIQTGEISRKPLVVVGRAWAETVATFIREADGFIYPDDARLIQTVGSAAEALPLLSRD